MAIHSNITNKLVWIIVEYNCHFNQVVKIYILCTVLEHFILFTTEPRKYKNDRKHATITIKNWV